MAPRHGFQSTYNAGCRCEACREAWRVYREGWRRRRGLVPRAEWLETARATGEHGRRSRYRKGCRCADCTAAEREYRAAYRARFR